MPRSSRPTSVSDAPGSGTCTVWEVAFSILNCTVGSGILALPFALKDSGFGLGLTLSVVVGVLCWFALYVLIASGQRIGVYKYAVLCEATMGNFGSYLVNGVVFFQTAGACVTYMIVVGDTIPVVIELLGFEILPLLFFRSIGSLAKVSIISVMTLPPILLIVAIRGFHYAPDHKRSYAFVGDNVFPAIGVMAFAMLSAQTAFLNFATLVQPTRKAWGQATGIAVSLSWIVSFVFAVFGFVAFGFDVQANIFNSFPLTDGFINVGRGLLGFSMFLTFPQAFYPARTSVHSALGHETNDKIPSNKEHFYTTIALFIPILICGVFIKDLGLLYQLIGGFCSTFLAYIIPGACYFLVFWYHKGIEDYESDEQGQSREDVEDAENTEDGSDDSLEDEQERLIKQRLAADKRAPLGQEEETISSSSTLLNQSGQHSSYGAISDGSETASSKKKTSVKERKTELWLDIGAGALLLFGVFVMILSTIITLRKMFKF
ncbi:hypothetical protein BGZ49_002109 [Haplosporangium sp. Z 27]|nr:hypothetical protein BGZ49_002109 [Haplosporangium sp. Z 27]